MTVRDYHAFLSAARDMYDLGYAEAQELYRDLRDMVGAPLTVDDLYDDAVADLVEELIAPEEEGDYPFPEEYRDSVDTGGYDDEPSDVDVFESRHEEDVGYQDVEYELDEAWDYDEYGDEWLDYGDEIEVDFDYEPD